MERYHEIIPTIKEVASAIGEWALNKIVPPESVELVRQESLKRTTQLFAHNESQEE